jgi:hypothetical protein
MEPEGSVSHSQKPAICFYPRLNSSSRRHGVIGFPSGPFPSGFPTKILYALFLSLNSTLTTQ